MTPNANPNLPPHPHPCPDSSLSRVLVTAKRSEAGRAAGEGWPAAREGGTQTPSPAPPATPIDTVLSRSRPSLAFSLPVSPTPCCPAHVPLSRACHGEAQRSRTSRGGGMASGQGGGHSNAFPGPARHSNRHRTVPLTSLSRVQLACLTDTVLSRSRPSLACLSRRSAAKPDEPRGRDGQRPGRGALQALQALAPSPPPTTHHAERTPSCPMKTASPTRTSAR